MKKKLYPVIILAGGLATRLRPLTETLPKALIPINNEPFINHQLRLLKRHGIQKVVLCVSYLGEMIEAHLGDGHHLGIQLHYVYDGKVLRGTGSAVKQAIPLAGDKFFVLYGDSYLDCDYATIQDTFQQHQLPGLMTVFRNKGEWDKSNVEYVNGNIIAYDKKYPNNNMHYIDYGLGVFSKEAFAQIPDSEPYDLADLYQNLLQQQQLGAYEVHRRFYEVGSFAGIKELEYHLSQIECHSEITTPT